MLCVAHTQFDKENEADRMLLMKVLLHAADIGNSVRDLGSGFSLALHIKRELLVSQFLSSHSFSS